MVALPASNTVWGGRSTDQAAALSYLIRVFHGKALLKVNTIHREKMSPWKKLTIELTEGCQRIHFFTNHYDIFNSKVEQLRANIGAERYQRVIDFIKDDKNIISHLNLEAWKDKYSKCIHKPR